MKDLSILVVDNDEAIRRLLQLCLTRAGHIVACASGGDEALKLIGERHFDLLITDVQMPDGDGLDLIMRIKRAQLELRILVVSGGGAYFQAKDCAHSAKIVGAHAALPKPFVHAELFSAIDRAMSDLVSGAS
jgi:two-component system nitrogen regulation response regulator GlnG